MPGSIASRSTPVPTRADRCGAGRNVRPLLVEASISDETGSVADREQLERGFRRLKPEQRAVVVLHYYSGFSAAEIARTLGIPEGTAQIATALCDRGDACGARSRCAAALGRPEQDGVMTTDKRLDEAISRWLEESAQGRLPERVLDATFERTRSSRQQVGWRATPAENSTSSDSHPRSVPPPSS